MEEGERKKARHALPSCRSRRGKTKSPYCPIAPLSPMICTGLMSIYPESSVDTWWLVRLAVAVLLGVCLYVCELERKRVKERGRRESTPARKGHSACSAVRYSHRRRSIEPTPILYTYTRAHIHTHTLSPWLHCSWIRMGFNEAHVTVW